VDRYTGGCHRPHRLDIEVALEHISHPLSREIGIASWTNRRPAIKAKPGTSHSSNCVAPCAVCKIFTITRKSSKYTIHMRPLTLRVLGRRLPERVDLHFCFRVARSVEERGFGRRGSYSGSGLRLRL
jgi:hypothetical protein